MVVVSGEAAFALIVEWQPKQIGMLTDDGHQAEMTWGFTPLPNSIRAARPAHGPGRAGVGLFLCAAAFTLGMGSNRGAANAPLSLKALYAYCGLPLSCDAPIPWEGRSIAVRARVDPSNIFDRRHYPQLPYEKFILKDDSGRSLEIWPRAGDNGPVFDRLARRPSDQVVVKGRLVSVRLPTGTECNIGVKMVIDHADQIKFQSD
jgi:hypothetical protein